MNASAARRSLTSRSQPIRCTVRVLAASMSSSASLVLAAFAAAIARDPDADAALLIDAFTCVPEPGVTFEAVVCCADLVKEEPPSKTLLMSAAEASGPPSVGNGRFFFFAIALRSGLSEECGGGNLQKGPPVNYKPSRLPGKSNSKGKNTCSSNAWLLHLTNTGPTQASTKIA
mmetsp:Transcript_124450/g.202405  ORF Transcript_124450/g.202405 Transcript_124450/m.202405 type:complete len:173 (-) Transcript_124450:2-520(-)